ncbi:MAG TPA: enoyl-CoA hydratase [Candidatus Eremiobacteraceae bacterium]|nr:enoyl-CoA hydratase [Candidatus Eremiobacteraceae bacterium]
MQNEEVLYSVANRVATITLNRPDKLNAWTAVMEKEVRSSMENAERDEDVRVIVLTGAGRGFCAGADMSLLSAVAEHGVVDRNSEDQKSGVQNREVQKREDQNREAALRDGVPLDFQKRYSYFPAIGKPVIAAINGPVVGLGLVITLYCDLRLASDAARFSTTFARRGLVAEYGMAWMLPRIVGIANALDLLFSARTIDAAEALRIGLVNRILPQESFLEKVHEYARELASTVSPRSLRIIKRQVYEAMFQPLSEAFDVSVNEMMASFKTEDFKEGVAHFVEKRAPAFTGR